jgi:hypothetical protein
VNGAPNVTTHQYANTTSTISHREGKSLLFEFIDHLAIRILLEEKLANMFVVIDNRVLAMNISIPSENGQQEMGNHT